MTRSIILGSTVCHCKCCNITLQYSRCLFDICDEIVQKCIDFCYRSNNCNSEYHLSLVSIRRVNSIHGIFNLFMFLVGTGRFFLKKKSTNKWQGIIVKVNIWIRSQKGEPNWNLAISSAYVKVDWFEGSLLKVDWSIRLIEGFNGRWNGIMKGIYPRIPLWRTPASSTGLKEK